METMLDPKKQKIFCLLCWLVYFTSYMTRINFGAVIAEIVVSEGLLKSQLSIVTLMSFISYGVGQIFSGILGDRLPSRDLIFGGLLATSAINLTMPFTNGSVAFMASLWFCNGFAQSLMWPPLVKIMTTYLSNEKFKQTCVSVSMASSVSTILIYLTAPLWIAISGWKLVFFISASVGIITAFLWFRGISYCIRGISTTASVSAEKKNAPLGKISFSVLLSSGVFLAAGAIIFQGILRDGITTWMPSFISETFHLGSSISILTAVILPIFSIICYKLAYALNKKIPNEIVCACFIFGGGFICCIAMSLFYAKSVILSVILSALITGCMHGVNVMMTCMVPPRFQKYGKVSTVSGALNSMTYIGSAISSYGFARLSEVFGWSFTVGTWVAVALAGTVLCAICIRPWKKFIKA